MHPSDFQSFLRLLKTAGELHRTRVEIDPALELTEVARRAIAEGKPALLVERPKGSAYPLVVNHYASSGRIELALNKHPDRIGNELITFLEQMFPPTFRSLLSNKTMVKRFFKARHRQVGRGISQEVVESPDLNTLPIQICWPKDGGRFITYGQVVTYHPLTGKRNIGVYRMHVFDKSTTGMHWQIQKGGGFHYYYAEKAGKDLEIAVALGTSPALLFASVAALPEGIDEAMFAGFLQNDRIGFTRGKRISINVPANAEFILEGTVPAGERRTEGPFGDHFGHYSAASEFPLFRIKAITHRRDPVYPATVVGRPPMEDKFLGDATQQMLGPLIRLLYKEVHDLWAYYEAGFHNLLAVSIEQRYQKEAVKAALGMMGTDQLSLTKCMILVSAGVNVRDWHSVLREIHDNYDPYSDFILIPKAPLDTLDFTSYKMNLGGKMIIDATRKTELRSSGAPAPPPGVKERPVSGLRSVDSRITDSNLIADTLLIVKTDLPVPLGDAASIGRSASPSGAGPAGREVLGKLISDPALADIPLIAAVSSDVDIHEKESYIWGIFTRFDCSRDVIFREQALVGISPAYKGTMGIDATWKPGYPEPLLMDDAIVRRVDSKWGKIWK